jgi:hypothetical protein
LAGLTSDLAGLAAVTSTGLAGVTGAAVSAIAVNAIAVAKIARTFFMIFPFG